MNDNIAEIGIDEQLLSSLLFRTEEQAQQMLDHLYPGVYEVKVRQDNVAEITHLGGEFPILRISPTV